MKKLELETSKGEFVVVDLPKEVKSIQDSYCDAILTTLNDGYIETYYPYEGNQAQELKLICKLSDITEEQAQQVVKYIDGWGFINYSLRTQIKEGLLKTAIESLHSLIESKGVHLYQNPYENSTDLNSSFFSMQEDFTKEKEAEQKTFYNPYLFKVI